MRRHSGNNEGLLVIDDGWKCLPVDGLTRHLMPPSRRGKALDRIDEGFQAGHDAGLGGMLVYFQLPQGLASHDILHNVDYEGIRATAEVRQPQPVKLRI